LDAAAGVDGDRWREVVRAEPGEDGVLGFFDNPAGFRALFLHRSTSHISGYRRVAR
jgi:hypothetical protein